MFAKRTPCSNSLSSSDYYFLLLFLFAAFVRLRRLKKLNLDSNNITEIKAFAFKGLRDMEEISVQNNPIKILSSFAFAGIRNVSSLMLGMAIQVVEFSKGGYKIK